MEVAESGKFKAESTLINKIDDYMAMYRDLFEKENEMELTGFLYGRRNYKNVIKNSVNEICMIYCYNTLFDENFFNDNSDKVKMLKLNAEKDFSNINQNEDEQFFEILNTTSVVIFSNNGLTEFFTKIAKSETYHHIDSRSENTLNTRLNVNLTSPIYNNTPLAEAYNEVNESSHIKLQIIGSGIIYNIEIQKLTDYSYLLINSENKLNTNSYLAMLDNMRPINFVEVVKGQHYYKEIGGHKSNIFSLNIKNSGLKLDLYSFDEMIIILRNLGEDYAKLMNMPYSDFISLTESYGYGFISEYKVDDKKLYKYFKYDNFNRSMTGEEKTSQRNKILDIMKMREVFEESVRKSIHRYIPVNTTLWKIEYDK